jgi:hypothetical protein
MRKLYVLREISFETGLPSRLNLCRILRCSWPWTPPILRIWTATRRTETSFLARPWLSMWLQMAARERCSIGAEYLSPEEPGRRAAANSPGGWCG